MRSASQEHIMQCHAALFHPTLVNRKRSPKIPRRAAPTAITCRSTRARQRGLMRGGCVNFTASLASHPSLSQGRRAAAETPKGSCVPASWLPTPPGYPTYQSTAYWLSHTRCWTSSGVHSSSVDRRHRVTPSQGRLCTTGSTSWAGRLVVEIKTPRMSNGGKVHPGPHSPDSCSALLTCHAASREYQYIFRAALTATDDCVCAEALMSD